MFQERFKTNPLNLVIATALLMGTMVTVRAYSGLIPADPASPNKCIYRGGPLELGVNNGISPCQRLTCNKDGSILIEGCGKLAIENCNRGERINQGKPFPECCKLKYKCQQKDSPPYFIERDTAVRT
ncbi:uncharacterized protein Dwil_GK19983 [Drosophila willistoni]|uniref:Single domain-containing protein n=1 Tax=Drosophila willistoni TaxID=7260 RepID=B4MSI9_DROWI|nr:uncharacterized protein LOC6641474 [Drosophila willistoni]EDW75078.2 uncharacterized protein Dwil_GK19983 [Drosophila willistoni]